VLSDNAPTSTESYDREPGLIGRFTGGLSSLVREIGKFGVVGGVAFLVDTGGFNFFRYVIELGPLTSKTISVTLAATVAYLGNRYWTWRHRQTTGLAREYFLFFVFNAVGLLISLLCLGFNTYVLGENWPGIFLTPLAENIAANGVGLALGTAFRFYSYRKWVFLPPEAPPVDPHTGLPEAPAAGPARTPDWYYDELTPGRRFDLGVTVVDEAEMLAYARRFDPQWYHIDPERAAAGEHGGLIASGWFTASLFMRAYVDHVLTRTAAYQSPGLEEMRWTAPVRAGDRLAGVLEVVERKPSGARPGLGTVTLAGRFTRLDEAGRPDEDVLRLRFRGWFGMRPNGKANGGRANRRANGAARPA
jgi:acyl dehydratase/putative flippase GtrA